MSDREYQLTEPWSAKVVDEELKKSKNAVIGSLEAAEKHISAKIFNENLHTSVKILQICIDLQDSVQRSLQNPAEKSCRSAQIRKDRKPGMTTIIWEAVVSGVIWVRAATQDSI